jgi:UDP-glucose 4-epimerase
LYQLNSNNSDSPIVFLIGGGVLGSSILRVFLTLGYYQKNSSKINWNSSNESKLNELIHFTSSVFCVSDSKINRQVILIWAAGAAGFSSSQDQVENEREFFEIAIDAVSNMIYCNNNLKLKFFFISSIGGLFEGKTYIDDSTKPEPLRAYGKLKVAQESKLKKCGNIDSYVFRLSSVYSYIDNTKRMGLVQTLIQNGIQRVMTDIYGNLDTLRDYVMADDVALAIYNVSQSSRSDIKLFHLTSGRPVSIAKIKQSIESLLHRQILLTYKFHAHNSLNMCCKFNGYSGLWNPSNIEQNLTKIYAQRLRQ